MPWHKTWRPKRTTDGFRSQGEKLLYERLSSLGLKLSYEELKIPYIETHDYVVDIVVGDLKHGGFILEYKGYFDQEDRAKMLRVKEQHPEYDIRFVFQRDQPIRKGSKTTYTMWATKHGFQSCVGKVPDEWLKNKSIYISEEI